MYRMRDSSLLESVLCGVPLCSGRCPRCLCCLLFLCCPLTFRFPAATYATFFGKINKMRTYENVHPIYRIKPRGREIRCTLQRCCLCLRRIRESMPLQGMVHWTVFRFVQLSTIKTQQQQRSPACAFCCHVRHVEQ